MEHWLIDRDRTAGSLPCARAAGLMMALGRADRHALASAILDTAGEAAPAVQCTVFAYECNARPRVLSVDDRRGGRSLHDLAELYTRRFYALDGNQPLLAGDPKQGVPAPLILHRQGRDDIAHAGYRGACYDTPGVGDRLALIQQNAPGIWLSIHLYKRREQGGFRPGEIGAMQALAPLLAEAAKLHYALVGQHQQGVPQMMLARLRGLCPALTKRELDVLRGVLEGLGGQQIAERMGIAHSSVATYQKRACRRLGVAGQRELFALPAGAGPDRPAPTF